MVQPDAVLEVAYRILDLGVAAVVGLQFQGFPVPVGDEAVIAVGGLRHIGGAVHPVGDRRPVLLGNRLDEVPQAFVLADGDGEADNHPAAGGDHGVGVEAAVGPHRELPLGPSMAHPPHGLPQEVGGAPSGVGAALAQPRHQHVAGSGGHGQQRVIAPLASVAPVSSTGQAMVSRPLLGPPVGLADGGVQVDGQRPVAGSGTGGPSPGQQFPAHPVLLADIAPPEAAQERPQSLPSRKRGVEGALTMHPSTEEVRPARSASASSMQSPPASAEATSVSILSPAFARPGAYPRSR